MVGLPFGRVSMWSRRAVVVSCVAAALSWAQLAHAACLTNSSGAELDERLLAAEAAYADLDPQAFGRALDDASLLLPCLSDVLSPAMSAQYHRLRGLRYYATGEQESALHALQAARTLEPGYVFPDELLPPDHALRRTFETLPTTESRTERPPQPAAADLVFDGVPGPRRPVERATLVQLVDPDGAVSQTAWVPPDAELPTYRARPRARNRLLAVSSTLLVASAGLYGAAWTTHAPFDDPAVDDIAVLESIQARSRTLSALSGAALVLGASGGVIAFTVVR